MILYGAEFDYEENLERLAGMERHRGFEPLSFAWHANILPLYECLIFFSFARFLYSKFHTSVLERDNLDTTLLSYLLRDFYCFHLHGQ